MYNLILFDLGDIFFEAHYWRKWMYDYLSYKRFFNGSFKEFYLYYEKYLEPVYKNKKDYKEAYAEFLKSLRVKNIKKFIKISFKVKKNYENNRKLYPGVKKTLKKIYKQGIINSVITDNELSEYKVRSEVIERYGINQYVDKIFTSKELKMKKPNPKIFSHILEYYQIKTNNSLFVGHDKDELEGARNFGLDTVLYNNYLNYKVNSKYKIISFNDILNII